MTIVMADQQDNEGNHVSESGDKGHSFRRRRLSLTSRNVLDDDDHVPNNNDNNNNNVVNESSISSHNGNSTLENANNHQHDANPSHVDIDGNGDGDRQHDHHEQEKAATFRKRRLSLTHKREEDSFGGQAEQAPEQHVEETPYKRKRRNSDASMTSLDSSCRLKSRIVHSSELADHPPDSPLVTSQQTYDLGQAPTEISCRLGAIQEEDVPGESLELTPAPKWKKRHTFHGKEDEGNLPFPRHIVGTYSFKGIEPIYDSDYHGEDDDDDDEDDDDDDGDAYALNGTPPQNNEEKKDAPVSLSPPKDKPTTSAKINQDRGGVAFPYGNSRRTALFAAYDGHGLGGELVSQYALHEVQRRLEKHPEFNRNIEKAFRDTFLAVDESLKHEELIEPLYAGTTACVVLLRDNKLIVSNVGDSRAVIARKTGETWQAFDLSQDQNPDVPEEQKRIEGLGGFVSPPPEPGLSARVWLDADCTKIGLAMARSIGDHAVKEIGVIAEPVVTSHEISINDDFVIIATDGVWEFISSQDAVDVVSQHLEGGATKACQALIEAAAEKWHEEEGDYRDDITALVIRLRELWPTEGNSGK